MKTNKKLLAIAFAGALAAAPAVGFAQGGPTLYGQAHVSIDYLQNKIDNSVNASNNSSRIGVKGSYDLGGGLAAIYKFEWGVRVTDAASNGSALSRRNQYAGLKSDTFGTLLVGRHDTPVKVIGRKADLFWSTQLGQNRSITNQTDGGAGFDLRSDNVIGYVSPNFGPVSVFAAYITDHGIGPQDNFSAANPTGYTITDNNNYDAISATISYDQKSLFTGNDKLFIGAGWERHRIGQFSEGGLNSAGRLINHGNEEALRVAARYDIGNWAVAGMFQSGKNLGFSKGADRQLFGGGVQYKFGDNVIKGQVYSTGEFRNRKDSEATLFALGIDHYYSKQVQLYFQGAGLAQGKRAGLNQNQTLEQNPGFQLGGSGHGDSVQGIADKTAWGISGGLRILF
jgi:predicted porin